MGLFSLGLYCWRQARHVLVGSAEEEEGEEEEEEEARAVVAVGEEVRLVLLASPWLWSQVLGKEEDEEEGGTKEAASMAGSRRSRTRSTGRKGRRVGDDLPMLR